jgi:hypothetical protein
MSIQITQDPNASQPDVADSRRPSIAEARDAAMRTLITRLARPHCSGGQSVERASLLAAGRDFIAAVEWIHAHGGQPESAAPAQTTRGLHSSRLSPSADGRCLRFVLPAAALD